MPLMMTTRSAALALIGLWPALGLAQESSEPAEPIPTVRYAAETQVDFEGLDVTARVQGPDGTMVQVRRQADFAPMIRLRADFNDELSDSVDLMK